MFWLATSTFYLCFTARLSLNWRGMHCGRSENSIGNERRSLQSIPDKPVANSWHEEICWRGFRKLRCWWWKWIAQYTRACIVMCWIYDNYKHVCGNALHLIGFYRQPLMKNSNWLNAGPLSPSICIVYKPMCATRSADILILTNGTCDMYCVTACWSKYCNVDFNQLAVNQERPRRPLFCLSS